MQTNKKNNPPQAIKSAETALDNTGSFREGTQTDNDTIGKII
jgi:hypothetical protein